MIRVQVFPKRGFVFPMRGVRRSALHRLCWRVRGKGYRTEVVGTLSGVVVGTGGGLSRIERRMNEGKPWREQDVDRVQSVIVMSLGGLYAVKELTGRYDWRGVEADVDQARLYAGCVTFIPRRHG